jgi:hypothetical protein
MTSKNAYLPGIGFTPSDPQEKNVTTMLDELVTRTRTLRRPSPTALRSTS